MKKKTREQVFKKFDGHCAYCGEEIEYDKMQVDHIKPADNLRLYKEYLKLAKSEEGNEIQRANWLRIAENCKKKVICDFGSLKNVDAIENLLPACADCNMYKSSFSVEQYRKTVKTLHLRMKYKSRMKLELFRKYNVKENQPFDGVFYFEKVGNDT